MLIEAKLATRIAKEKHVTNRLAVLIKRYASEQEVADYLGCTRCTLRSRLSSGGRRYQELSALCFMFETDIRELEKGRMK